MMNFEETDATSYGASCGDIYQQQKLVEEQQRTVFFDRLAMLANGVIFVLGVFYLNGKTPVKKPNRKR